MRYVTALREGGSVPAVVEADDGALYVADFYNRIIGHYEVPLTHPGRDRTSGRIWRIVYRGKNNEGTPASRADWTTAARHDIPDEEEQPKRSRLRELFSLPPFPPIPIFRGAGLTATCAAMAALVLAMIIWRNDVVRLLPQTAGFYRLVGLEVNLRGLAFKDIKITYETVDAKPVLVIEGMITGETREPVGIPRLRFSVRDAQGAEVYAWNAVLEQSVLKPGERAWFKTRLASPPPEGRNIDIRFFNKRDLAAGQA